MCFYLLYKGAPVCFIKNVKIQNETRSIVICFNCKIVNELEEYYVLSSKLGMTYLMDKKDHSVYTLAPPFFNEIRKDLEPDLESFRQFKNPSVWRKLVIGKDNGEIVKEMQGTHEEKVFALDKNNANRNKQISNLIRERKLVKEIVRCDHILVNKTSTSESKRCKVIKMLHFKQFNFTLLGEFKAKDVKAKKRGNTSLFELIKIIGEQKVYRDQLSKFIFENIS